MTKGCLAIPEIYIKYRSRYLWQEIFQFEKQKSKSIATLNPAIKSQDDHKIFSVFFNAYL